MAQQPDAVQETLERELKDSEGELARLEKQEQDIARRVADLRATVRAYQAILERRSHRGASTPPASAPLIPNLERLDGLSSAMGPSEAMLPRGGRIPGNRGADMPERVLRFRECSVADAILQLAAEWHSPRHADEYAKAIWRIDSRDDLKKARRTLNSTIGRLARAGALKREGFGGYGPKEMVMTA